MYLYYIILIIFIIFIILIIINNNQSIEHYDARYTDVSVSDCAEWCKTNAGCSAFGYNKKNKTCYPSKNLITGKPFNSMYADEYLDTNATCNKPSPIMQPQKTPSFFSRRANAQYVCTESYNKYPKYFLFNDNKFRDIGEGNMIDAIFDVQNYEVKPYTWPKNKFDYENLDLLVQNRAYDLRAPSTITNINNLVNVVPKFKPEQKLTQTKKVPIDYGIGAAITNIINKKKVSKPIIDLSTVSIGSKYKRINEYNSGKINKCVTDIPLEACIKYCSDQDECVGVEWNPNFDNNMNVCCVYNNPGTFVERDNLKKLGKFYLKEPSYYVNTNNTITF